MRNLMKEWMEGHITITVRGKRFERLINLAVRNGLAVWNIRRPSADVGQCEILVRDFFRLRPLLRETGCRVHVERREGFPFWLVGMRRRIGLPVGALVFFVALYMLSSFVWSVEVKGTRVISAADVEKAAARVGLKPGTWKGSLKEPLELQRELLLLLPRASWVGVQVTGTKATIQVVEKEQPVPPEPIGPRHLVAKKRAVIHRILAEAGKSVVSVNQFVEKGQVLISGIIGNEKQQRAVAARGEVEGEVWYVSNVSVPLKQIRYAYTGEKQQHYSLVVGPYAVHLWPLEAPPLPRFERHEERHLLSYVPFPFAFGWKREDLAEVRPETVTVSREEAIETAKRFARQDVLNRAGKDATIKEEKVLQIKEENGKVYVSIHYAVIEDIAEEQPFAALPPAPREGTGTRN